MPMPNYIVKRNLPRRDRAWLESPLARIPTGWLTVITWARPIVPTTTPASADSRPRAQTMSATRTACWSKGSVQDPWEGNCRGRRVPAYQVRVVASAAGSATLLHKRGGVAPRVDGALHRPVANLPSLERSLSARLMGTDESPCVLRICLRPSSRQRPQQLSVRPWSQRVCDLRPAADSRGKRRFERAKESFGEAP